MKKHNILDFFGTSPEARIISEWTYNIQTRIRFKGLSIEIAPEVEDPLEEVEEMFRVKWLFTRIFSRLFECVLEKDPAKKVRNRYMHIPKTKAKFISPLVFPVQKEIFRRKPCCRNLASLPLAKGGEVTKLFS